jgi:class 3 adenylate cyclase
LEFRVLGPLTVLDGERELRIGGAKRRTLLARLLADANHAVSVDLLLDDLWPGRVDSAATATLQSHVSQMRKVLGIDRVESGAGTYRIVVANDELDALAFTDEVDAARRALAAGERRLADTTAEAALARWRGRPYHDAEGAAWSLTEAARLDELHAQGNELLIEIAAGDGDHSRAVVLAQRAIAAHPLRERLWAHLIAALYLDGRQADALRAYQQLRTTLRDELGIEPSAELRSLEQKVLAQDPTLRPAPAPPPEPAVRPAATPPAAARHARDGERRQLTIAFCDLVESTPLSAALDPEDYRDVVREYQAVATTVVERHGGVVGHYMGDGWLVYFGFPRAREDDAARAARSALELVEAVAAIPTASDNALAARVGIATGVVVVGEMGHGAGRLEVDVTGDTPNLAARLQGLAPPGGVIVADSTRRLLEGWAECETLEPQAVRGFGDHVVVHRLLSTTSAAARFDAAAHRGLQPLVGRATELAILRGLWDRVAEREGAVVVLSGEPGIGKSRLVRAFVERSAVHQPHVVVFRCSSEHASTPLHPVAGHLAALPRDAFADVVARSRDPDAEGLLRDLAGAEARAGDGAAPPTRRMARTLAVLREWLATIGGDEPGLVVFEDVHWADPTTLELLTALVDTDPIPGVLVVMAARPEFEVRWPPHGHITQLTVNRLTDKEARALIAHAIGTRDVTPDVVQQLLDRSDRVPLHVEELVRWALHLPEGASDIAVPSTLHDSLMARLDALGPAREVAQHASVIGRDVDVGLLAAVMDEDVVQTEQDLEQLVSAGLLIRRGAAPLTTYRFRHALLRDAAYASLLRAERRSLHLAVARELLASHVDTVGDDPEVLAHHFEAAEDIENATRFWRRAGRRAEQRSATTEAIDAFSRAVELSRRLPDSDERDADELRTLFLLGPMLHRREGAAGDAMDTASRRALELSERLGRPFERLQAVNMVWGLTYARGDWPRLVESTDEQTRLARAIDDPLLLVLAHQCAASTALYRGDIASAETAARAALEAYEPEFQHTFAHLGSSDPGLAAAGELAWCQWHRGAVDTARATVDRALVELIPPIHPYATSYATINVGVFAWLRRDPETARSASERALALATEHECDVHAGLARWTLGWSVAKLGDPEFGLALTQDGQSRLDRIGFRTHLRGYVIQGEILLELGRHDDALAALAAGQGVVAETEERREAAELWRLEAEVRAARDRDDPRAGPAARHAPELARAMPSAMFELRALTTLLRVDPDDAVTRAELGARYAGLVEGAGTPDVQDAAAVLTPSRATRRP